MDELIDFMHARLVEDTDAADAYIDHFSPGRALAEIDAKRRIVNAYARLHAEDEERGGIDVDVLAAWREAVEALSLPYADHPDYRQEWNG